MKYNINIAEILQRYHNNNKMFAKMSHSNIMAYHSYITVICDIYVMFI